MVFQLLAAGGAGCRVCGAPGAAGGGGRAGAGGGGGGIVFDIGIVDLVALLPWV